MPNLKNQQQLDLLKSALADSKAVIITNYSGLTVAAQQNLQNLISEAGGKYSIFKNTIIKLALKDKLGELPEGADKALEGQTAILIAPTDPITPTKALMKFYKDNELPEVKIGFMLAVDGQDGSVLSSKDIENLSKLPGREQLLGMLAAQLNAPISSFAQVLRANLQSLVFVMDAVRRSKE